MGHQGESPPINCHEHGLCRSAQRRQPRPTLPIVHLVVVPHNIAMRSRGRVFQVTQNSFFKSVEVSISSCTHVQACSSELVCSQRDSFSSLTLLTEGQVSSYKFSWAEICGIIPDHAEQHIH